jgi:DNA-directed RNA polymerase subunit RPC12/RpoP
MSASDPSTFICARCGGTFDTEWSDDEADAEYKENFPEVRGNEAREVVCDDCYKEFMAWHKRATN